MACLKLGILHGHSHGAGDEHSHSRDEDGDKDAEERHYPSEDEGAEERERKAVESAKQVNPGRGLIFCVGKMRVCRHKAAKWRRGTGLVFLKVNAAPSRASSESCEGKALCVFNGMRERRSGIGRPWKAPSR